MPGKTQAWSRPTVFFHAMAYAIHDFAAAVTCALVRQLRGPHLST